MIRIPKIIHQVWSNLEPPLPAYFKYLAKTWKRDYPDWKYELWDNERMNNFILIHYPHYWERYNEFPHNIQRWDIIRYLILDHYGGVYVDFDYESIKSIEHLLAYKNCFFCL
ncbi:MAG: hypothetical protein LUG96_13835 [Tannerellaceae bacterium]|nr:hypothetical protein [Tannerellaceae bacterium]